MADFSPTPEQEACIEAARGSADNLIISALAGAAKTSTLVLLAEALKREPILSLAFNKRIAQEMEKRLPGNCTSMTLNSIGHRTWAKAIGKRLVVDARKNGNILKSLIDELPKPDKEATWAGFADILKAVATGKSQGYVPGRLGIKGRLRGDDDFFAGLEVEPTALEERLIEKVSVESIRLGQSGMIDFDDQILLPTVFPTSFPQFPLVMIDEAQDLSPLNHATLRKLAKKRLIAVGDSCQPDGTMITVVRKKGDRWNAPKLEQVPIEEVLVGDTVLGYDSCGSFMYNRQVEGISYNDFDGDLVEVSCNRNVSRYTPNHKCYANFKPLENQHALYLMKRGENYRIGKARFGYDSGCGPILRARVEGADAVWVLCLADEVNIALLEAWSQAHFGIPDLTFVSPESNVEGWASQEYLDNFWGMMQQTDLVSRAKECLTHFGRDHQFPFWRAGETMVGVRRPMIVHAANLISGCLMLPYTEKKTVGKTDWYPVEVGRSPYSGRVTSFTISDNRLYIADGIVTHNCQAIYAFRGADESGMGTLESSFHMRKLLLSVSFRCPRAVVEHVRWRAPHMQYPDWARPGEIRHLSRWSVTDLPEHCAIICRNNAPIFSVGVRLLRAGRYPHIVGNDVGKGLIKVMKKLGDTSLKQDVVMNLIDEWETKQLRRSRAPATVHDKTECLRIFAEQGTTLGAAIAYAESLMNVEGKVQLMTGHKSKGLEFDSVFFLDEELVGPDGQDSNLRYVICTRAKDTLTYVQSKGFEG